MWLQLENEQIEAIELALSSKVRDLDQAVQILNDVGQTNSIQPILDIRNRMDRARQDIAEKKAAQENPDVALYKAAALKEHHEEGECEIDDDAIVSMGADPGAYVMAWIWVAGAQAGISEDKEGEDDNG